MTEIKVETVGGSTYRVTLAEAGSSTICEVTASSADVDRLGGGGNPEKLIEASFRFLLDREPKESMLSRFDLSVISRYFPEYPARIADYL